MDVSQWDRERFMIWSVQTFLKLFMMSVIKFSAHGPRTLCFGLLLVSILDFLRGVSWSEVATVPKRKSHRGLDLNLSLNTEVNIWKGWKESGGTK